MVRYALSLGDDDSVCLPQFHTICATIGEFGLAAILYVLYLEDDLEREQLPVGQVLP